MFRHSEVFPGVFHITDAMGVSFTLVEGKEKAVLFDTGYGTEDAGTYVKTLTDKPVKVYLSHGHHDHMLGARWFEKTRLCKEDMDEFLLRTGEGQRKKVMNQAAERGVPVPDDFLDALIPLPDAISFRDHTGGFESLEEELGGMTVKVIHVPGHTPGSIVMYVAEYGLILTGDDWNPCTWMWFPTSMDAQGWRENMRTLVRALEAEGKEIRKVLCSHQPMAREGKELKEYLAYMTDERIREAPAVDMGAPIDTHQIVKEPEGWVLVFDRAKVRT